MVIGQLPGQTPRRVDFMYASPSEYAFAILVLYWKQSFKCGNATKSIRFGL